MHALPSLPHAVTHALAPHGSGLVAHAKVTSKRMRCACSVAHVAHASCHPAILPPAHPGAARAFRTHRLGPLPKMLSFGRGCG